MAEQPGVSVEALGKSKAYLKLLLYKDVLEFMAFLTDIIVILSKLSLLLQEEACVIGEAHLRVQSTITLIKNFQTRYAFTHECKQNTLSIN